MPSAAFREHLDTLAQAGFATRSVGSVRSGSFLSSDVGVSFDDGYSSAARAADEIAARGWSATLFIVPAWVGSRTGFVAWADVLELAGAGIEIGAHGSDHSSLCGGSLDRMVHDLRWAREAIEQRIGAEVAGLAYPFGLGPATARAAARAAGFAYACTTEPGRNSAASDPYRLRRNEVLGTDTGLQLLAKLGGSDDWMRPVRRLENALRCR